MTQPIWPVAADVVVGTGIVGASVAGELARHGKWIVALDRGQPLTEQSSRAWGFVRQQGRHPAEIPLAEEANALWQELTARYGQDHTGFEMDSILTPAETGRDLARGGADYDLTLNSLQEMRYFLQAHRYNWRQLRLTLGRESLACGFSGHGFALGPAIGRQIAQWIEAGRPSQDLSAFRLARFAKGNYELTHHDL